MNTQHDLAPVSAESRIPAMDILRGFALLGIFAVNIKGMVGPLSNTMSGTDLNLSGANYFADAAVYIFGYGKFYLLFSLLFGMGFAVMLTRAREAGRRMAGIYLRRLLILFLIGVVHGLFIWSGDILVTYSIFGLILLLFFRNTPQSRLPKWAALFYLAPIFLVMLGGLFGWAAQFNEKAAAEFAKALSSEKAQMQATIEAQRAAYGNGTYADMIQQAMSDRTMVLGYMAFMGWMILAMFLLGAWFIRSGALRNPESYPRLFKTLRTITLPIGLILTVWSFWLIPSYDMDQMDMIVGGANAMILIGGLMMSLGYMAWILKGLESPTWAPRLSLLAPAGRMALTNYLLQSVIGTLIFYNHGLGLYEQLPRVWQIPFVIVIFALQVVFSKWWLSRFNFGPVEWLWRALTYLRIPPMKIRREISSRLVTETE